MKAHSISSNIIKNMCKLRIMHFHATGCSMPYYDRCLMNFFFTMCSESLKVVTVVVDGHRTRPRPINLLNVGFVGPASCWELRGS